jgi:glyoxylase-like metal-dependent hydrolase (beta-lactamase superfamily II)
MPNLKWRIGDVTVTRLFEGGEARPRPAGGPLSLLPLAFPEAIRAIEWMAPDWADEHGNLRMSLHALLVDAPGFRLLVDTCVGNGKQRSSPFLNMWETGFLADLDAAGWPRDSVDGVLCTHLHVDHVGWNTILDNGRWVPTFPNARYYMARSEVRHWLEAFDRADPAATPASAVHDPMDHHASFADSVKPILDAGLAELVETDAIIAPGIRLMPTPGHTPGHVSVSIESKGERAVITGDMMHHPCQIAHPEWSSVADDDAGQSVRTRLGFFAQFADTPTLVIGTHFGGPTAGLLAADGASGYWLDARGGARKYRMSEIAGDTRGR